MHDRSPWRHARAPGSSANLGPGFDALGIAVPLRVDVWVRPAVAPVVRLGGSGRAERLSPEHLLRRVWSAVGSPSVEIVISSEVPLARGLGSSGALAVALAGALGSEDPFAVAAHVEGHPENAAASWRGGAVVAVGVARGRPLVRSVPLDPRLRLVLVIPERRLSTSEARAVLPERIPRADVVANLQRAAALVLSLGRIEDLESELFADRLHEPWRAQVFREAEPLRRALLEGGCVGATWSGAGPTMVGFATPEAAAGAAARARDRLVELEAPGSVLVVTPDGTGLVVDDAAPPRELVAADAQPLRVPYDG